MSKVYNKIVQSNTEPSKNDIWLKDGQMKTFGKEGWKPVGGGVSEGNNESVGDKEIYVLDATRTDYETLFNEVSEAWDYNKQIILKYNNLEGYRPTIFNTLLTKGYRSESEIVFGTGPFIIPVPQGNGSFMVPFMYVNVLKDNIIFNETPASEFTVDNVGCISTLVDDKIELITYGDGTQFLSDDGSYKAISTSNNEPYIFEYSDDLKNIGLDGLFELNEAITSGKKIIIRYKFNDITPMITVPEEGVFNGGVNFYFVSHVPGEGEYLFSVDVASWDYSVSVAKHALNFQ